MAYDFTPAEFKQVWDAFHTHADPETHTLSVADLHAVLLASLLVETIDEEDITWFIRDVNAVDTGKLSVIKLVKGVGDLIDHKGARKKSSSQYIRPNIGRRFTWREIADLFKLFLSIDVDKSGEISFSELYKALRYINPRAKVNDALSMFAMLDIDKSHAIDFPEFVRGISLGGADVGAMSADSTITNAVKRGGRPLTKSSQRSEPSVSPPSYLETQEIFRNVEGDSYAKETSSPHFPMRMPTNFPSSSRTSTPHSSDPLGPPSVTKASPPSRASPPQSGSRLYSNWAQKNAKPAPVLDQRVPVSIVHTKPSFLPSSAKTSPPSSRLAPLPSSSSPSSPSKRDRLPTIDNVK